MTAHPTNLARPAYCPNCGYDLRGAAGRICSECGAAVGKGITSQIPWMQRKWRGTFGAFWATAWLALRRPLLLVDETQWRLPARDGRAFARVSVLLTSFLLTAWFALAFIFHGPQWLACMPNVKEMRYDPIGRTGLNQWLVPTFALWDGWFILIPFFLTTLLSLWLGQSLYRRLLVLAMGDGGGDGIKRRRLQRMGFYFAGLLVWGTLPLGLLAITAMIRAEEPAWAEHWQGGLVAVQAVCGGLAAFLLLAPTIRVMARPSPPAASWKWWYWLLSLIWGLLLKGGIAWGHYMVDTDSRFSGYLVDNIVSTTLWSLCAVAFLGLVLSLALWKWRWQMLRITYFIVVYPVAQALLFAGAGAIVLWMCGFVALAAGSMLRH